MEWMDVLRGALSFFLVITALGLAYLFVRMAGVFAALRVSVGRITDEVVPILDRVQTTMDGVNQELARVDDIMVSAVGATKGAERAVGTVANAVATPVRKLSGLAAGVKEAAATFRARRAAEAADRRIVAAGASAAPHPPTAAAAPPPVATTTPPPSGPGAAPRHDSPY